MKVFKLKTTRGLIHIYHGNGKGKTTCGMGLCVRAAGAGKKVLIYQFLKDSSSSELKILEHVPGITVIAGNPNAKFTFAMSDAEKEATKQYYKEKFQEIIKTVTEGDYDLLFMDEVLHVIRKGMLSEATVIDFLKNKPEKLEVVMNGYDPSDAMREVADYISFVQKEKHPFDQGIPARIGIEK